MFYPSIGARVEKADDSGLSFEHSAQIRAFIGIAKTASKGQVFQIRFAAMFKTDNVVYMERK